MSLDLLIRSVQAKLGITVDGIAGSETWNAIHQAIVGSAGPVVLPDTGAVESRDEAVIATLLPEVQPYARALINAAAQHGIKIHLTSGTRTYEEQDALYEQGRTKPGKIVTNARGGYSVHNFGLAFDITVFDGMSPIWEGPEYATVGQLGKEQVPDEPHYSLRPEWAKGLTEAQFLTGLRDRHNNGRAIFA